MLYLAIRHLVNRPHQTILTFIGLILGAAGYIVFSGLQIGYSDYVVDRLVNVDAYVRISPRDSIINDETFKDIFFPGAAVRWLRPPSGRVYNSYLSNIQGWFERLKAESDVVAYSPQLIREVIFSNGKFSYPVRLVGVNTATQRKVTNMERDIVEGSLDDISRGDSLILIGRDLMKRLGAHQYGTVNVINPDGTVYQAKIVSVYHTGIKEIDYRFAYSSLSTVQKITRSPGEISSIVVRLADVNASAATATRWQMLSSDKVESWDQSKEDIRVTLKTQGIVRNATTFTIMLIIAFGIYNILNMVVNQKKREIAILRSLGFSEGETIFLFLVQGMILGLGGGLFGMLVGGIACHYIEQIKIGVGAGHMPMSWDAAIYLKAFSIVLISSIIASFLPARNAGRLSPIEIIRWSA
ncbi:MAG TPA: FtsX-like permease family protein [Spirochaetota bacterium]|nr:FtsX-like permease family protein [Spirochaetota bacterium]